MGADRAADAGDVVIDASIAEDLAKFPEESGGRGSGADRVDPQSAVLAQRLTRGLHGPHQQKLLGERIGLGIFTPRLTDIFLPRGRSHGPQR